MAVNSLINHASKEWNTSLLLDLFVKIRVPIFPTKDKLTWVKDSKGIFSTKSAHQAIQEHRSQPSVDIQWKQLWKMKMHERNKMLVWRIGTNILPTRTKVATRVDPIDTSCPLCCEEEETSAHLFFKCLVAKAIWFGCQ